MDYKNKYEHALERMKIWISEDTPDEFFDNHEVHSFVFPELADSDDERVKNDLVRFVEGSFTDKNSEQKKAYIAWIEKQDEQSKKNAYIKIYELNNEICGNIGVVLSYKTINKQAREILNQSYEFCQDIFRELQKLYPEIDEVIDPS